MTVVGYLADDTVHKGKQVSLKISTFYLFRYTILTDTFY